MIVAIHQPNFFPWAGFFAKMARADIFVLLDAVEFSAGSHTNRVQLLFGHGPGWVTCPVKSGAGAKKIMDVVIGNNQRWKTKFLKSLHQYYGKTPYFNKVFPIVSEIVGGSWASLAMLNIQAIKHLARLLDIHTTLMTQSDLSGEDVHSASGSRRLIGICKRVGGNIYLAGGGSLGYEDVSAYAESGIEFRRFSFSCRDYPQRGKGPFTPGLSILDAICNIGVKQTRQLLVQG